MIMWKNKTIKPPGLNHQAGTKRENWGSLNKMKLADAFVLSGHIYPHGIILFLMLVLSGGWQN